jgi:protein gp37
VTKTNISWATDVWNPVVGCTKVSPGCRFCYAQTIHDNRHNAWKSGRFPSAPPQYHHPFSQIQMLADRLDLPLRWKKPRMIFVNSMSDLFHERVPDEFISDVYGVMVLASRHTFQVLTKRPERMARFVREYLNAGEIPGNVWLGTSVEDQRRADERIPHLLQTPAAVRFLSCEPLLGPLDLRDYIGDGALDWSADPLATPRLHWVICGGESGSHLSKPEHADRWMRPEWARDLRDQSVAAGVAFWMKQHSALRPGQEPWIVEEDGSHSEWHQFPEVADGGH